MAVRVGVDVGGTFTKAVACDTSTGAVVARCVLPTTHSSLSGVADGVVSCVSDVARQVAEKGLGPVVLVGHSTTQAVNALLEGDTPTVGVLALARRPELRRARKRTSVGDIALAPGRTLTTRHVLVDVTDGLDRERIKAAMRRLVDVEGADVVCVSEAFGVDDARGEWLALEIAEELGVPACAGHELTGLYGLEMRTVTGALNASILPTALQTARLVEEAVERDAPGVPLLVMRGDCGTAGLAAMKRHPLLTAFSGPAASVAGALRHLAVNDAVVIEVGGTSTNVSMIRGGRPVLSYVRVLEHVTSVRSLDVRVVGVAGGSLIRVGKRLGRTRIEDVGPRSAHIAGLPYACFADEEELKGAEPRLIAPRPGDPARYLVLERPDGKRFAVTVTCAANASDEVPDGAYARANASAAREAFAIVGAMLGCSGRDAARAVLDAAGRKVAAVVADHLRDQKVDSAPIVGLGGGAGALVPTVARMMRTTFDIPADAEVISSVGDARSIVRVEIERSLPKASAAAVAELHRDAEEAAIAAGASPSTVQVESQAIPERGALRVVAFGSVELSSGDVGDEHASLERRTQVAEVELGGVATLTADNGFFAVFTRGDAFCVVDRHGAVSARGEASVITGSGAEVAAGLAERIPRLVRHYGPISVAPAIRVLRGPRLADLTLLSSPEAASEAALNECALAHDRQVIALVGRA